jgi:hypothetical protein
MAGVFFFLLFLPSLRVSSKILLRLVTERLKRAFRGEVQVSGRSGAGTTIFVEKGNKGFSQQSWNHYFC